MNEETKFSDYGNIIQIYIMIKYILFIISFQIYKEPSIYIKNIENN